MFTNDTFTDTASTLLENHTGETGAVWTKNPVFGSGSAAITAAGRLRGNGTNAVYYASGTPASADYDVEADMYIASALTSVGLIGRQSTSAATYYLFDREEDGSFHFYTVVNGSTISTTSFAMALTVGQTYRLRLSLRGSQIICYVNGAQVMQITDSNITAAGRTGIFFDTASTDTTGCQLDNFTGAIPATVAVTDTNLFFSPYNWHSDGAGAMAANNVNASSTFAQTNTPGAYLKFAVSASSSGSATLLLDTTPLNGITAGNCPTLVVSVDGGAFAAKLLAYATGTTRLQLAGNLSAGSHTISIYFRGVTLSSSTAMGDRWTTPASSVKVTALELDGRGSVTALPVLGSKRMLVFGDSITEGADAVGSSNANADQDATQTYAQLLAAGLDAEPGIVAFSAQGWTIAGWGNVPKLYDVATPSSSAYDKYAAGASRLMSGAFAPAPDYVVVLQGRNDATQGATDAGVTSAVAGWIAAARAAAPLAKIFVVIPFDGSKRAAITAGVAAAADSGINLIDLGTAIQATVASGGLNTNDGIHPNARGHATFAAMLFKQIRPLLGGSGASSVLLSTGAFVT